MARLAALRKGDWDQFDHLLSGSDLSAEEVVKLTKNPEVLQAMLTAMREQPAFRLIHSVFNTVADIRTAFSGRLAEKGVDVKKFSWAGPEKAPDYNENTDTALVLDATLGTLKETFEYAWEWACDGQDKNWRLPGLSSDTDKLEIIPDAEPFCPWTLRWRRIRLNAGIGQVPTSIEAKKSLGTALLFVSAQHPERIRKTDYKTRFGFWLPGLRCTVPGSEVMAYSPYVCRRADGGGVGLDANPRGDGSSHLGVPVEE
ncbi:MAG: hypothetical protein WC802_03755 [Patescibacteria group bacterium]|jgi:hypothetical protein